MVRINPYTAMVYQSTCWQIEKTADMKKNVEHVVSFLKATCDGGWLKGLELPLRLVTLPEAFCTGWTDCSFDMPHLEAIKKVYDTTVPGEETDMLGEAAKSLNLYIMGCMQAKDPELMKDRFFNTSFVINPKGKVIHKAHKSSLYYRERACCPTDIWDRYVEKYGTDPKKLLNAVYPVTKTDIGNLGALICGEADKPEPARALALNGAEIIYRPTYVGDALREQFILQNRAHAHFNTCYVIGPGMPNLYIAPWTIKDWKYMQGNYMPCGEASHIIDYKGNIIAQTYGGGERVCTAIIDIEQLRHYRCDTLFQNFLCQLRVEQYILAYQYALNIGGIYPKNLAMDEPPMTQKPHDDLLRYCINKLVELGIWTPPEGWKPYKIPKEILSKIEKARNRAPPKPK